MTLSEADIRYLDARFDTLEAKLGEAGRATVRRLNDHEVLLHGEEGRSGIVGDVQDLRGDQRILRALVLYLFLPVLVGGILALIAYATGTWHP